MQTLFDLPMSSSLSYFVAVFVILGLLAMFAVIVRRVAGQGMRPEGGRGRGPRLGVVDTFALDRTRQLVIVRRDDVEHLLMIGGTSDVVIESNIVRALPASTLRDPQNSMVPQTTFSPPSVYVDPPVTRLGYEDRAHYEDRAIQPHIAATAQSQLLQPQAPQSQAPQPQAPQPQAPQPQAQHPQAQHGQAQHGQAQHGQAQHGQAQHGQMPRLKVYPAYVPPAAPSQRATGDGGTVYAPQIAHPQNEESFDPALAPTPQQAREALSHSELQALAKRLEASIPPLPPKPERPTAPQQMVPASAPMPNTAMPNAAMPNAAMPNAASPGYSAPQQTPSPAQTGVSTSQPSMALTPSVTPPVQSPVMSQPRAPVMPQAMPMPSTAKPAFPQTAAQNNPSPLPQRPAQPPASAPVPEPTKDNQAATLDENLRRLLGRKIDPR